MNFAHAELYAFCVIQLFQHRL